MGKGGAVVGLNIGSNTIKAVELQRGRDGIEVTAVGIAPTPEEAISNGVIVAPDVLGGAIKELFSSSGIRSKSVVSSVAGQSSLVVRIIEVPKMSDAELKETMGYEVERHIPFAATEVIMDFKPLRYREENPDAQNMEVLLCVAQEDMINAHVETLEAAGLLPHAIDIEPLAAARATVELLGENTPGETIALLNIGCSVTDISVVKDGCLTFTRAVPVAGDTLTQAVIDHFGVDKLEAERIKKEMGTAFLTREEAAPVDFSGGAVGVESIDFASSTGGVESPDFDFGTMGQSTPDQNPFQTQADTSENPFLTAEPPSVPALNLTEEPAADATAIFRPSVPSTSETASENPFDLSLTLPAEEKADQAAVPDNPFDLSLGLSSSSPAPDSNPPAQPGGTGGEVNPFDLSLDLPSAETLPQSASESVPEFSLNFGESTDQPEAAPAGPLFDLSVPAQEESPPPSPFETPSAPTASPGMNPFLQGGGQAEAAPAVSPGMNPFLQGGEGEVGEGGMDDLFSQDNPFADSVMTYAPQAEVTHQAVHQALAPVLSELVAETRRSLEYYTSRYPNTTISRLIVLGGTARLKHLDNFLSNELGIRVVVANPFEHLSLTRKKIPEDYVEELAPTLAISAGLALRDML